MFTETVPSSVGGIKINPLENTIADDPMSKTTIIKNVNHLYLIENNTLCLYADLNFLDALDSSFITKSFKNLDAIDGTIDKAMTKLAPNA